GDKVSLRDVLGQAGFAKDASGDAVERVTDLVHQLSERLLVAATCPFDEVPIHSSSRCAGAEWPRSTDDEGKARRVRSEPARSTACGKPPSSRSEARRRSRTRGSRRAGRIRRSAG